MGQVSITHYQPGWYDNWDRVFRPKSNVHLEIPDCEQYTHYEHKQTPCASGVDTEMASRNTSCEIQGVITHNTPYAHNNKRSLRRPVGAPQGVTK